ncbi:MAG: hypothetical protein AAB776_00785 [Patescibacteria group bacterium]
MILLHRLTPFAISLLSAAGFGLLMWDPLDLKFLAAACFLLIPVLFARLLLWELRRPAFWVFLGTPSLLLLSSLMFFLIIESTLGAWAMALSVTLALALYAENLFAFYHLPSSYQAYSLEFLSLMCYMVSAFFFTGSAYMAQLFLELPLWIPAIATFLIVLLATVAVFWVSKIGFETGILFAVTGAIIMTQVYVSLSMLPTSFVTHAAAFTVFWYIYLGISRAHVLEKLTPAVVQRYAIIGCMLLGLIFGTATWT